MRELRDGPFALFLQLGIQDIRDSLSVEFDYEMEPVKLRDSLLAWSEKWNLADPWLLRVALNTLDYWREDAEELNDLSFCLRICEFEALHSQDTKFKFTFKSNWDTPLERRKDAEARIRREFKASRRKFERKLKEFLDRLELLSRESGAKKVKEKYNSLHFEMLMRYQVQLWTHSEIAQYYHYKDPSKVAHIIPEAARMAGLTLRKRRSPHTSKG